MSNPVDDYLKTKEAASQLAFPFARQSAVMQAGKQMAATAGKGLMHGAAAAAGFGLATAAAKAYSAMTKKRDFEEMLSANPDLVEAHKADPVQFVRHYNALRRMNPQFAAEPVVAGSYMRSMSESPETAGRIAVEAVGAGRGLPRPEASLTISEKPQAKFSM
jgi:F0F1-type ATP synthase membrane subunit c/vacuolar-type H+-ATPase subunit K